MGFNSGFKGLMQLFSWGWAHSCSKHVENSNKHITEEIVSQVGYLSELHVKTVTIRVKTSQHST